MAAVAYAHRLRDYTLASLSRRDETAPRQMWIICQTIWFLFWGENTIFVLLRCTERALLFVAQ
jgi:hypothetical protein